MDLFGNALGRVGFQYTVQEESGAYAFTRGSLNLPEIAAIVAIAVAAAPYVIGAIGTIGGALASIVGLLATI